MSRDAVLQKDHNVIGICGDWHGNGAWAERALVRLHRKGVRKVFQVGDFGLWPGMDGLRYLDTVNATARRLGITVYALGGNHDWWPEWNRVVENGTAWEVNVGGAYIRSHIVLLPRTGHFFMGQGSARRHFAVAAGAVSIDKAWREPGRSWWPEEELTDAEVDNFPTRPVDILLTHDCSNRTPFRDRLKPDLDSVAHRQRIDRVLAKTTPAMHFHGHMHTWYDWMNNVGHDGYGPVWTQTYGLNMDGTSRSTGILDLDTMKFDIVV